MLGIPLRMVVQMFGITFWMVQVYEEGYLIVDGSLGVGYSFADGSSDALYYFLNGTSL